ncbi:MAG: hypothetical protein A2885_10065 [Sphingopyxis sp. RIFCSPHIGHO2_01_FULL_65_24]|nr:MAG: hypothetical protein A2885_10065 [Sphingopyxis sp. RIFCSPHIGHO2_01_FULL_65_24]
MLLSPLLPACSPSPLAVKRLLKSPPPPKLRPQTRPLKLVPTPLLPVPTLLLLAPKLLPLLRLLTLLLLRLLTPPLPRLRTPRLLLRLKKPRSKSQPLGA